jgi:predicted transcriptional regulator
LDQKEYILELEQFFKALADANRLKIIGLLANGSYSVEQLAGLLDLSSSTVSHHLAKLSKAGLVSARAEGYYNVYRLETGRLEKMSQQLLARETLPAAVENINMDAYDQKILSNYTAADGRLKEIPAQQKKFEVILRHAVTLFELNRHYSEKEVNEVLAKLHKDTARLRRGLVELDLLARSKDGREYWRVEL